MSKCAESSLASHARRTPASSLIGAAAERAAKALRGSDAEPHLVVALEDARDELSATQKRLLQQTHFAVPSAQTTL